MRGTSGSQERHICSIHTSTLKIQFHKNHQKKYPKSLRYTLRANPVKSSISPISTTPKITTYHSKITSTPYKLRLQSNSTKNHTQSTKFHLTNHQKSNIKITQNTSKINTFQLHQTHKQYHSIEVIIFYNQTHIKKTTLTSYPNNKTTIHHTKHSLPEIIRLNQRKSTQISIKITSMIKYSHKKQISKFTSKTQI